jgi:diguanylate cyclase (GGDEF)-like protein
MDAKEYLALEHIHKLLRDNKEPELTGELERVPLLKDIHGDLSAIRAIAEALSVWDIDRKIDSKGLIPGCLKSFQSQLHSTLEDLRQREESLQLLAENLRHEVDRRDSAVEALQKSESQFKYLASHDHLTGAMNRRSFMERAAIELKNAVLLKNPCGITMMDIDFFKNFNDSYGHLAGDEALRHVVRIISSLLRKNDFLGRYGGEEFVFLFSNADEATGLHIAERVREAIQSNPVQLENGPVVITASFGVAMADLEENQNDTYIESLINDADSALYQAKHEGRNKVISFRLLKQGESYENRTSSG